jgi:hypothetical protein
MALKLLALGAALGAVSVLFFVRAVMRRRKFNAICGEIARTLFDA